MDKIRITISIDKEVNEGLLVKMKETGRTKSNLVSHLLRTALGKIIREYFEKKPTKTK